MKCGRGGLSPFLIPLAGALFLASSAWAESPVALSASGGFGFGGGSHADQSMSRFSGLIAVDFQWKSRPGSAYVLFAERAGSIGHGPQILYPLAVFPGVPPSLSAIGHEALMLGIERSHSSKSASRFLQAGLGVGRAHADIGSPSSASRHTGVGLALGAAAGVRVTSEPGPVGVVISLRASHVAARTARFSAVALVMGLTTRRS